MTTAIHRPEQIRLGVIGCGPITLNAHADAIAKAANIRLHALADWDAVLLAHLNEKLRPTRCYREGRELIHDPKVDLVLIAVHDRFHVSLAQGSLVSRARSDCAWSQRSARR
jgi:predicted dehydrogenase